MSVRKVSHKSNITTSVPLFFNVGITVLILKICLSGHVYLDVWHLSPSWCFHHRLYESRRASSSLQFVFNGFESESNIFWRPRSLSIEMLSIRNLLGTHIKLLVYVTKISHNQHYVHESSRCSDGTSLWCVRHCCYFMLRFLIRSSPIRFLPFHSDLSRGKPIPQFVSLDASNSSFFQFLAVFNVLLFSPSHFPFLSDKILDLVSEYFICDGLVHFIILLCVMLSWKSFAFSACIHWPQQYTCSSTKWLLVKVWIRWTLPEKS